MESVRRRVSWYTKKENLPAREEMTVMKTYDVVILGSGAGANLIGDVLEHGKSLALVDRGPVGGTCLNTG